MKLAIALVLLAVLRAADALAWESQCAVEPPSRQRTPADLEANVCGETGLAHCEAGLDAARAAQLGEHTLITDEAMALAGISSTTRLDHDVVSYFADDLPAAPPGSTWRTVEPSCPGAMRVPINRPAVAGNVARRLTVPEFSQVPDLSYSLGDWALGNEHCVSTSKLGYSEKAVNACHTFASHTSVVNSNHFPPQARAMYQRYHRLALEVMDRCRKVKDAGPTGAGATSALFSETLARCEKEGLAFEAFAAHFLEDAWSSGHMWQRWGTPRFPAARDYALHHLVGVIAGIIHGLRGPFHELSVAGDTPPFHDQLCKPGPQTVVEDIVDVPMRSAPAVQFASPSEPGALHWAAGDLYYPSCTARELPAQVNPLLFVRDVDAASPLSFQRRRMMTCIARGFAEVYDRGPKLAARLERTAELDTAIAGSLHPLCWEQRVTNRSMWEGTRLGHSSHSVLSGEIAGHAVTEFMPRGVGNFAPDPTAQQAVVEARRPETQVLVRASAVVVGGAMALRAARSPDGIDVANLEGFDGLLASLAGVRRNQDALPLYAADADDGGVPYLERDALLKWDVPDGAPCTADDECQLERGHTYCDRFSGVVDGGAVSRCAVIEKPVLRAFRDAEAPYWCGADDWASLEAARRACEGKPASSAECQACAQVVAPKLRNACDPGPQGGLMSTAVPDPRSMCDQLKAAQVTVNGGPGVNWPYARATGESWSDALRRAAMEACRAGAQGTPAPTASLNYQYATLPPVADTVSAGNGNHTTNGGMCGRSDAPVQWFRWRSLGDSGRTWRLELSTTSSGFFGRPQPVSRLSLDVFAGPRCDVQQDLRSSGQPVDTDGDGAPDLLRTTWANTLNMPDEICVRVTVRDEFVRTGYRFQRVFP